MNEPRNVIVVAGPTASGKSDFAVQLALIRNGEIISADSRQVYKGLDIGTGKITEEEKRGVPHHMLDVIDSSEVFSVAAYASMARPILEDILARGKTPIICGGTGQYIDALIYDTELPAIPPDNELRERLDTKPAQELYEELKRRDPARADRIDPHNKVRLIRALEIIESMNTVPELPKPELAYDVEFYLMNPSRDTLRKRITARLDKRLRQGMIQEVESVARHGFAPDAMKRFGLEYHVIGNFLEGRLSEEEMKTELINKSMQYAKRQGTWNRKYHSLATLVEVS